jgi:hypothetical protein
MDEMARKAQEFTPSGVRRIRRQELDGSINTTPRPPSARPSAANASFTWSSE